MLRVVFATGVMLLVFALFMDNRYAMHECQKIHSYETCHYTLNR